MVVVTVTTGTGVILSDSSQHQFEIFSSYVLKLETNVEPPLTVMVTVATVPNVLYSSEIRDRSKRRSDTLTNFVGGG